MSKTFKDSTDGLERKAAALRRQIVAREQARADAKRALDSYRASGLSPRECQRLLGQRARLAYQGNK